MCRHYFVEEKLESGLIIMREHCSATVAAKLLLEIISKAIKVEDKLHAEAQRN